MQEDVNWNEKSWKNYSVTSDNFPFGESDLLAQTEISDRDIEEAHGDVVIGEREGWRFGESSPELRTEWG